MYIKLLTPAQVSVQGKLVNKQPGDWVDVGKQTALQWISLRKAVAYGKQLQSLSKPNTGILMRGRVDQNARDAVKREMEGIKVKSGPLKLHFTYNILWTHSLNIPYSLFLVGVNLLDTWQIACPLLEYETLALHEGTPEDREATKEVIHDLRVMLYDTRLVFVRRSPETDRFIQQWIIEIENGGNERLAFLRALHTVKPLILPLPYTWTIPGEKDKYDDQH